MPQCIDQQGPRRNDDLDGKGEEVEARHAGERDVGDRHQDWRGQAVQHYAKASEQALHFHLLLLFLSQSL